MKFTESGAALIKFALPVIFKTLSLGWVQRQENK